MELQKVIIHLARRYQISITNIYLTYRGSGVMVYICQGIQHHLAQSLTQWNSRRSLSTWLGDIKFQLLTSTCLHIILTTPPSTKLTICGSIIYQKSQASSMGTSMLINIPRMTTYPQTLGARRFTTGWKHTQRFC